MVNVECVPSFKEPTAEMSRVPPARLTDPVPKAVSLRHALFHC